MRNLSLAISLCVVLLGVCSPVVRAAEGAAQSEPVAPAPQGAPQPAAPVPAPEQEQSKPIPVSPVTEPARPAAPAAGVELVPQPVPRSSPLPAQLPEMAPTNDQVVEPQVERRPVKIPHIPSNNVEFGIFGGAYDTEYFGTNAVYGARLGYDITEDFFLQAAYGQTKVSDSTYRLILPGGIFPVPEEILRYYDLSVGYNILPGEFFFGRSHAKVSALYLIAGLGETKINGENRETFNFGFGNRVFLTDWMAVQVDVRDYIFSLDILGVSKNFQNFELTAGLTFFF